MLVQEPEIVRIDAAQEHARVLVVTDPVLAGGPAVAAALAVLRSEDLEVEVLDGGVPELPMDVVLDAIGRARDSPPGCVIGVGGGSSLDLAKLVALGWPTATSCGASTGEEQVPGPIAPVIAS